MTNAGQRNAKNANIPMGIRNDGARVSCSSRDILVLSYNDKKPGLRRMTPIELDPVSVAMRPAHTDTPGSFPL